MVSLGGWIADSVWVWFCGFTLLERFILLFIVVLVGSAGCLIVALEFAVVVVVLYCIGSLFVLVWLLVCV